MPDQNAVHYDTILSNLAQGYENQDYIGDKLMPPVSVGKKSDKYPIWGAEKFQRPRLVRAPSTRPATVDYQLSDGTFYCVARMLDHGIDDDVRDNADKPFDLFRDGTELITEQFLLDRECRVAELALDATQFAAANKATIAGNSQWNSGHADSTPLADIRTGIQAVRAAIGRDPNTLVMSSTVRDILEDHSTILSQMQYTNPLFTIEDFLRQKFGFTQVLTGKAKYDSAHPGQTATLTDVWSDSVLLAYVTPPPTPSNKRLTFGYQMVWKKLQVGRLREDMVQTSWIRGTETQDEKITCADAGYLMSDTLA